MTSVLVIEDDPMARSLIREVLIGDGFEVVEAADAEKGSALYRARPTDVIIVDLFLPNQQGLETILRLLREFPRARVIAITGGGEFEDPAYFLRIARAAGAQETLAKPFSNDDLLRAIERLLADSSRPGDS